MTVGTSTTAAVDIKAPPPENSGSTGYRRHERQLQPRLLHSPSATTTTTTSPTRAARPSQDIPDTPKTPDPDETPPLEDFGTSVEGELLSATAPLPPSSGRRPAAPTRLPPDPEKAIEEAEEISAPGALIAAGVVVGLLGPRRGPRDGNRAAAPPTAPQSERAS